MQTEPNNHDADQKDGHFDNYADYSRTLRAWLVAYGIGGPVLFLTNDKVADRVALSGHASQIIVAFLIGVGAQILLAMLNKWGAWHMYRGAGDPTYQRTNAYTFWDFINSQYWIDLGIDVISLLTFTFATWRVLEIFFVARHAT